jgi:hypothetical protein
MPRPICEASPLPMCRVAVEAVLLADRPGLGQIGADFWDARDKSTNWTRSVYGRYPQTGEGAAAMCYRRLLHPGPDGPVPTLRCEVIREGIQESGYALDSTTPYPWGWTMVWYGCGAT